MKNCNRKRFAMTVGLDLGNRYSTLACLGEDDETPRKERIATSPEAFESRFRRLGASRVVLECGSDSPWVCKLLEELGHEVLLANPRRVALISQNHKKTDEGDAELLARMGRADPQLLSPVQPRDPKGMADLAVLDARNQLVRARTDLVNHIRGKLKTRGIRVVKCSTPAFVDRVSSLVPEDLGPALNPLLGVLKSLTAEIDKYDRVIEDLSERKYPETSRLRQVAGVGPVTALAFVLVLQDRERFPESRQVGPYLGLTPRRDDSGDHQPQLRISKAGNSFLRRLLVSAAQYVLGPFGPDTDLRRHGKAIAGRGGRNAKKRAVVAVARKLAVLLHRLWVTADSYEPLRNSWRQELGTRGHTKAEPLN